MTATVTQFPHAARQAEPSIVALCGGVGGPKLAHGLDSVLPRGALTVIVNTGDDFQHLGLNISPDLDIVLYTLGGRVETERGWGRAGETWDFMAALDELGGETWFQLGDRDMAMHVLRTHWLQWGRPLSAFISHAAARFGISARIVPMTDDTVSTWVSTGGGLMPFQHYFMRERCAPVIRGVHFEGAAEARPAQHALTALSDRRLKAIVICPSNPYLCIDPILAIPGIRAAMEDAGCPVVAVSPIVAGKAVFGPTAKIMTELGFSPSWQTIARHYGGLLDGLLIDECETPAWTGRPLAVETVPIRMDTLDDRRRLAEAVLAFAGRLRAAPA